MPSKKLSKVEAIAVARAARQVPKGVTAEQYRMRLTDRVAALCQAQNPIERGVTYALGEAIEANGYLLLYKILDALGCRIISTMIHADGITIMCRHKTYEGQSQSSLLLEIIQDCIENFGILGGLKND
ncbi:MAG: hypothetical protein KME11_04705 [Timaviella obliquedivisa GSE-PSE-MK23-08B]|jgi:hypothetical protein|nr:hypothetical protein [Timaviella obliquedivisa GSE-PSE-MK23-08B]